MSANPVAVFSNCFPPSSLNRAADPSSLVKGVVPDSDLKRLGPNALGLRWAIANKYYSADVEVIVLPDPLLPGAANPTLEDQLASRVEALVLCFDAESAASFELVKHWRPFLESVDPAVRLLVAERCGDESVPTRNDVLGWCIDNQFELVELDEERDEADDEEESEGSRPFGAGEFGVPRIVAALQAHSWSNLRLKEDESEASGGGSISSRGNVDEDDAKSPNDPREEDDRFKELFQNINLGNPAEDDADEESFNQLFNQMANLKSESEHLPFEERKAFAEKVTMAFWRAIGGDEDEIAGLDDD